MAYRKPLCAVPSIALAAEGALRGSISSSRIVLRVTVQLPRWAAYHTVSTANSQTLDVSKLTHPQRYDGNFIETPKSDPSSTLFSVKITL